MKKTLALLLALTLAFSCITVLAEYGDYKDPAYYETTSLKYGNVDELPADTVVYENANDQTDFIDENGTAAAYNQLGFYAKDAAGTFWVGMFNATNNKDLYCRKITDLGYGGKYTVSYDMKFAPLGGADRYQAQTLFLYDGGGANYMGFIIDQKKSGAATVTFHYRHKDSNQELDIAPTLTGGSAFSFNRTLWYTLNHTIDTINKVATLEIYQGSKLIASYEHEMLDAVNGNAIKYDSKFQYDCIRVGKTTCTDGFVGIKNLNLVKQTKVPVTGVFNDTLVDVTYNGKKAVNGEAIAIPYNSSETAEITVTPKDASCEVAEILVDGKAINSKTTISFTQLKAPASFEVKIKGSSFLPLLGKQTFDDLAEDSGFRATETNGNVYYKVDAKSDWNHIKHVPLGSSGEYTIEHKVNFCGISAAARKSNIGTYLSFSDSLYNQNKNPLMGFQLAARFHGNMSKILVTPQFFFRWNGSEQKLVDLAEPIELSASTWYTTRHTYNFDNMTATLEIYDKAGENLVYSVDYELPEVVPGTSYTVPYSEFQFRCIYADATIVWVGYDDLLINKTTQKNIAVSYDSSMGTVTCDGTSVANGEEIVVDYNNATAKNFAIEAKDGYVIEKVLVNDAPVATDTLTFKNVITDQKLEVVFAKKVAVAPVLPDTTPTYVFDADYETGAQVAYFTVNTGYGYTFTDGIAKFGEVGGEFEKMENSGIFAEYLNNNWNGRYGIKVFGAGLEQGASYVLAPYLVAQDENGNTVTIDPVADNDVADYTFTFGE